MKRGELAESVGLSIPAVSERLDKMQRKGVIRRFSAVVDVKKLGLDIIAFVHVNVTSLKFYPDFTKEVQTEDKILECYSITGHGSFMLKIVTRNTADLERLLSKIQNWHGVSSTTTSLVLSEKTFKSGHVLSVDIAPHIARAMKEWAIENNATHYCHWFQPMTGSTAEKHDAFIAYDKSGTVIEKFTESQLIQGEPDASSFPSGGMRSTFEARGYTAWDTGSFAFLRKVGETTTLCIPSVFISYHGDALDEKTPLLRSMNALNKSALRMLKILGNHDASRVTSFVGAEQEYFLIDNFMTADRMDLIMSGRTLFGSLPPKTQQLEDHYFGSIPERIIQFMHSLEKELYELGIPVKTRHNEVAPRQFEIAPLYEEAHLASDHNLMVMEVMRRHANAYGLSVLLHEKPFAGVNGSGKHNNWSMGADVGGNLLEPGDAPHQNISFLVFVVAVLMGVHKRAGVLRASVANTGNDHRLGANEAPPAIMSVFLGHDLSRILDEIEEGKVAEAAVREHIELGLAQLPKVQKDNTDRNRTSPFAFTGNKFEFRAVPSSANIAIPNTVLNTIIAESIDELSNALEARIESVANVEQAIFEVLSEKIKATKAIRFEGDGYSKAWELEAKKRGLPNMKNMADAMKIWSNPSTKELFIKYQVLTAAELESRLNVRLERYKKDIEIEAKTFVMMIKTLILPACLSYQKEMVLSIDAMSISSKKSKIKMGDVQIQYSVLGKYSPNISKLIQITDELEKVLHGLEKQKSLQAEADYCANKIMEKMVELRGVTNELEKETPRKWWPVPTYFDMLFTS
ncbi:hypothetical protein CHS0354_024005 [Potamilus streckersoni]|uniref:Glutamine synthetase n=1 Tax=Potamilus streckersoni TaxID=2493646 RepID=A0AAE0RZM8_9BIVA|nr:hypothetical protein CHS0354_024005 [Potamilus streckersoni]